MLSEELELFLDDKTKYIKTDREETKAYIKGIFIDFIKVPNDKLSLAQNITYNYYQAKLYNNFIDLRNIGDTIFWLQVMTPEYLSEASPEYYNSLAQNSYYKCHIILNEQWPLFEEMAHKFEKFVDNIKI